MLSYDEIRAILPTHPLDVVQRLGVEGGTNRSLVCDGLMGPKTRDAEYMDPSRVCEATSRVALKELLHGVREVGGNNRGPEIELYSRGWRPTGEPQDAWCAFFASWCVDKARQAAGLPEFSRVGGARRLVKDHCSPVAITALQHGDLIAWESIARPHPYGHVGICVLVTNAHVWTIEGNANLKRGVQGVTARRFSPDLLRVDGARMVHIGTPK